jgi:TP901 family phage tail tape measure protein
MSKNETASVEVIIKGQQPNATLKEMDASLRAARAQMRGLKTDSAEFAKAADDFKKINTRLQSIRADLRGTGKEMDNISKRQRDIVTALKNRVEMFAGLAGITAAAREMWTEFKHAITQFREFDKAVQNLSAITGASGKDLEFYKNKAMEMGSNVKGGATAVVEAYKLIGSAKPELLESKELMVEVTEQAILLSQAAGIELPEAATRLTDAMNQFNAPAKEALKYVDALAAGAKYGAAEIDQETQALVKFGVGAKSFKVDIFESIGLIQLLAEKGLKGADAGTAVRNILGKMSAADVIPKEARAQLEAAGVDIKKLMDKTIPLIDRLKELSKIAGSASAITKVFGEENKNAGEAIIANLPRLEQLIGQVHETGVAAEQAAKNMDTLDQAFINAGNAYDNLLLSITRGGIGDSVKKEVNMASAMLTVLGYFMKSSSQRDEDVYRRRITKMSELTRQFGVDRLQDELKTDVEFLKSHKFTDEASVKSYAESIRKKMRELEIYREVMAATSDAEKKANGDVSADANLKTAEEIEEAKRKLKEKEAAYKAHLAEMKRLHKQLMEELGEKEFENSIFGDTDYRKEQERIWRSYQKFKEKIDKDEQMTGEERAKAMKTLRVNTNNQLEDLDKKHFKEVADEYKRHQENFDQLTNSAEQQEINDTIAKYDAEIKYFKDNAQKQIELEEAKQRALNEIRAKYRSGKPGSTTGALEGYDKYKSQIADAKKYYDESVALFRDYVQIRNQLEQLETQKAEKKTDNDLRREQRLLDSKAITQKEYNERVETIEQERENRERTEYMKAAQRERQSANYNAILAGAEAVSQVWSKWAAEPPVAYGLTALALGITAGKLALINSTPPPEYWMGGYHDPEGYTEGRTLYSSSSGQPFVAGERGKEYIVSNTMLQNPVIANDVEMFEAIRTGRTYAGGGFTSTPSGSVTNNYSSSSSGDQELKALIRVNTKVMTSIQRNGIAARLYYDTFQKNLGSIDDARESAAIR